MKININELDGKALDWAVTKAMGYDHEVTSPNWGMHGWATKWEQGGPIIEEFKIGLDYAEMGSANDWVANCGPDGWNVSCGGTTALLAAMRSFVAYQSNEHEIEVPEELLK